MITLQQLLMTDSDLSGGTLAGKGAEGAQDFLSLLAGALTETTGKGKDAPLTLADLKAAGSKLSKAAQEKSGDTALQAKIAELISRQETLSGDDTTLQSLVSGLKPATGTDALKVLAHADAKADPDAATDEDELAGLSALMAMLPHQQIAAPVAPQPAGTGGAAPRAALTPALAQTGNGPQSTLSRTLTGQENVSVQDSDKTLPAAATLTPVVAAAAEKQDVLSTPSSTAGPTATLAPILSGLTPSQPAATVATAPVLSQPLGTPEWQQNLSQHITLFTKQGQQTAELRLHPEDLGQVHISLKLDDNQAQLQMVSPHGHVRAALEAALPVLRTQLAENGIQLSQSSVSGESFAGQQQSSSGQQQHASRSGQHGGFNDEGEELLPAPAALQSAARGTSAVDIFA
ncbi:TPA: flagellar hook length control protein FliK [Enterobacter cloacae]|nr:flagellar hook length control protein FliK [Enterobacter pasteurii]